MAVAEEGEGVADRILITTYTPVPDESHNLPDSHAALWESLLVAEPRVGTRFPPYFLPLDPCSDLRAGVLVSTHCCLDPSVSRHAYLDTVYIGQQNLPMSELAHRMDCPGSGHYFHWMFPDPASLFGPEYRLR